MIWYKNSFLASVVSMFGCAIVLVGIYACIDGEWGGGLGMIVLGIPLIAWGGIISENKKFKKWWKQVTDNNLEPAIARSIDTAVAIYNKNPQNRTLKKIEQLNPAAAQLIRQSIAQNKAKK